MLNASLVLNPNPICLGIGCIILLGGLGVSAIIATVKDKKLSVGKDGFKVDNSNNEVKQEPIIG